MSGAYTAELPCRDQTVAYYEGESDTVTVPVRKPQRGQLTAEQTELLGVVADARDAESSDAGWTHGWRGLGLIPHDFFVAVAEEQIQGKHVVHDHVRRRQPLASLSFPALIQDIVDEISTENPGEYADTNPFRRSLSRDLDPFDVAYHR
ncbi:hypothetical protein [Frankia tisae]|uniref:hypothetical protein n=1 Tax=Frankia tisae TaxID=2950104 RepID=UPI0021C0C44F|nr:hypothetical protein [Frankia tisae]